MQTLILDGDTLPGLAIARSLGSKGIDVVVASHEEKPIAGYSRYVSSTQCYPHPLEQTDAFLEWLSDHLKTSDYNLVIPATERTIVPIARRFNGTPLAGKIAMPALSALDCVLDKAETSRLAQQCGVPQPKSWEISSSQDIAEYQQQFSYPCVIKPGRSIADGKKRIALSVRYAHDADELEKIGDELLKYSHLVVQTYFRGIGVGIELLASEGDIIYAFQHQRLHEMPLTGGGSSYRKSVELDSDLLEAARGLIKRLNWHGVAMVEFMRDSETREFVLVEINGRFWGSLPLAIAAGADFPYMLHQLYTEGKVFPPEPYRRGIHCRKLSSDMQWLEAVVRKDADPRLVKVPAVSTAIRDLMQIASPRHYFDAQSWRDPLPGLVDLKEIVGNFMSRLIGLLKERRHQSQVIRKSRIENIRTRLSQSKNVLYLCYGNINRSAVAHVLSLEIFRANERYDFRSAGFHLHANRPPDPRMAEVAAGYNVSMSNLRSSVVTPELIDWADIIFVMEAEHITRLAEICPEASQKCFLLGGLTEDGQAEEIIDPYNKPEEIYQCVYEKIVRCISLLDKLSNQSS